MSFANNCLLARRLVERGVRFVQLYHSGWDHHGTGNGDDLVNGLPKLCREIDQGAAALVKDLKQRGLLDETLVVWGGEFGRTPMNEERDDSKFLGRDHHPRAFTMWLAGGGIKPGIGLARPTSSAMTRSRTGSRSRLAGHDPAPAGPRPHEADVQLPGPRLPPDRRARGTWSRSCWRERSRPGSAGVEEAPQPGRDAAALQDHAVNVAQAQPSEVLAAAAAAGRRTA